MSTGHIFIYGGIGSGPGEVSLNNVKAQIDTKADDYIIHVMSPGGDVFEGYGIYNILRNTGKKITAHVEGLCASIATLIVGAADEIIMNRTSEFMIHNPQISDLKGDANQLRNVANQLDKIKNLLIDVYERRTGLPKEKLWQLYDNETWLTADEAKKMGFVDTVQDAIRAVAKVDLTKITMEKDKNLWDKVKNLFSLAKIKNEYTETLQDGTLIIVASDDEDWTGKQVFYETGEPLPDGDYTLMSGKVMSVAGGTITEVKDAAADNKQDEEMNNKIQELEAQLAEAKAAKSTAEATAKAAETKAVSAEAKVATFQNRMSALEQSFLKLKEQASQTQGDTSVPAKGGATFKNVDNPAADYDPMGEDVKNFLQSRNRI